jgi:hypothetical protein
MGNLLMANTMVRIDLGKTCRWRVAGEENNHYIGHTSITKERDTATP